MNIKATLTKVVDPRLELIGFKKAKLRNNLVYPYEREQGERVDTIHFQKLSYSDSVKLMFNYRYGLLWLLDADSLPPNVVHYIKISQGGFIPYKDEENLENILIDLTNVIIERIPPLFEALARPNLSPSAEMQQVLASGVRSHAEKFMCDYGLPYHTDVTQTKQLMLKIEGIIMQNREREYDDLRNLFIEAAAYIGEFIICTHGGTWIFDAGNRYVVQTPSIGLKHTWDPLSILVNYWNTPEIFSSSLKRAHASWIRALESETL